MIILEKPYVSEFLINTIKENNFNVLDNEIARKYFSEKFLISNSEAVKKYDSENELFYTNSENSISWISEYLNNSNLLNTIEICKNKALFRKTISEIYPEYYFKEFKFNKLFEVNPDDLKFPFILKPCVGFLSFGVYPVKNKQIWGKTLLKLKSDIEKLENIFPKDVVNMSNFIIEEMIEGEEYAIDAYFNDNSEAVILNIFQHPFFDDKDVSDRAYFSSKIIFEKYYDKFLKLLNDIGKITGFKNFPFHLELRANEKSIIPIEINPMRFCGWCITDIAKYCWGINVYEYYLKQLKPDWKNILSKADNSYYYFTIGDIPKGTKPKDIDYNKYLKNISSPLDVRKIDFKNNPIFAIVFAKTNDINEIKNILKLDMKEFIIQ